MTPQLLCRLRVFPLPCPVLLSHCLTRQHRQPVTLYILQYANSKASAWLVAWGGLPRHLRVVSVAQGDLADAGTLADVLSLSADMWASGGFLQLGGARCMPRGMVGPAAALPLAALVAACSALLL